MSLHFRGWGANFLGWGSEAPAPTVTKSGAGKTIVIPRKKPVFIATPGPKPERAIDDDEAILIHLLQ